MVSLQRFAASTSSWAIRLVAFLFLRWVLILT